MVCQGGEGLGVAGERRERLGIGGESLQGLGVARERRRQEFGAGKLAKPIQRLDAALLAGQVCSFDDTHRVERILDPGRKSIGSLSHIVLQRAHRAYKRVGKPVPFGRQCGPFATRLHIGQSIGLASRIIEVDAHHRAHGALGAFPLHIATLHRRVEVVAMVRRKHPHEAVDRIWVGCAEIPQHFEAVVREL